MAFDVSQLLGLGHEPKDLTLLQIALRALIVFIATLIIVRLADKRFMARINALDAILTFVLGSMLARAVNGSAAFFLGGDSYDRFGDGESRSHRFRAGVAFQAR